MIMPQTLENLSYRLGHYYLGKLWLAESTYQCGHDHSAYALSLFDAEWAHIQKWQEWVATHFQENKQIATLCKDYSLAGGEVLIMRQPPLERRKWLEAGLAAAQTLHDQYAEMVHLYLLARVSNALYKLPLAQEYAEKALALAQHQENELYICKILLSLGVALFDQYQYKEAQDIFERAFELSLELDAKQEVGAALNCLSQIAWGESDYIGACEMLMQYLKIGEELGRPHDICLALRNLSLITQMMGDEQAATGYAERCVQLSRMTGNQRQLAAALGTLGELALANNDLAKARNYAEQSLKSSQLTGRIDEEVVATNRMGILWMQSGNFSTALECFASVITLSKRISFHWFHALALLEMAKVFRLQNELDTAAMKLREGLAVALTVKRAALLIYYLLEAALLWHERGQSEQVVRWIPLLKANLKELDKEQQAELKQLTALLQEKMGDAPFSMALEQGKAFDLDQVMQALLKDLSNAA